ncbi:DEAD/DEAH box helicase [Ensifer sp. ENS05]|uniref:DEAD/DEAH box helicase n=1 Tax=Ensifer sp. ENS05 TaxID=2769277 RepID=UPI001782A588|nr:DEAD/DEAH box helicase [Ensifer sp. ENS05]MBD9597658.1 DEAD/DEAH box helicase [Ensifer sp. ENS05]
MQDLADKVWANRAFHETSGRIQMAWLRRELGSGPAGLSLEDASKLMRAASILAASSSQEHRTEAFRAATCTYELFGAEALPLDQALRVVLTRLGNFPSFHTRSEVANAGGDLPLSLATEELVTAEGRTVVLSDQRLHLTNFQHDLWINLVGKRRVALAAPTSAGKSFVLQNYLASIFNDNPTASVVYIVPTRALIAQVSEDLRGSLAAIEGDRPEIVTVPIDPETPLPACALYVMTQERVQLALTAHPDFRADTVVVDEAHSIADGARGVLLQWVVDDLLRRKPALQIMFASPIIENLSVFGRLFGLDDIKEFPSVEPTVSQNFLPVGIGSATKGSITISTCGDGSRSSSEVMTLSLDHTIAGRTEKLVHIAARFGVGQSNIVYANGAAEAEKIALQLADLLSEREPNGERLALADLAKEAVHPNYVLIECVKKGVAFHYSNIPTQLRRAIEQAASDGHIDFLVCTSTLLQGVNLPAKNVFMCAPEKGRMRPLESTDFWNLSGRAGRLRREFQGNIFLIDYDNWKTKPLDGPKGAVVVPAIETSVRHNSDQLLDVIANVETLKRRDEPQLESTFVRLFSDMKSGELEMTLGRVGIDAGTTSYQDLSRALATADAMVTLPAEIVRRTPNVSAHKQQRLFDLLAERVSKGGGIAHSLIPLHPRESGAFQSYADILELCHDHILGLDTSRNLHRFHALLALKWMRGVALPQIIDEQLQRKAKKDIRTVIRETLDLIETQIRFQAVRLFGCYNALLIYALDQAGYIDLASSIPAVPLYLEVGASDKTMISFISLGLSRVSAMKLNDISARKDLDKAAAMKWLSSRSLESLGLSPLLTAEVASILAEGQS